MVFACIRRRDQVLPAVLYPANGAFHLHGNPGDIDFLGDQDAFVAKTTAHIGGNYMHLVLPQLQAFA